MRAYVIVTGILFALLVIVHIWRAIDEGAHIAQDPAVAISTLLAVGMCVWAISLLRRPKSLASATRATARENRTRT